MAESKFLKYQDPSGDGLIDVCDAFIEVAEVPCEECKCIKKSTAVTPNWRNLDDKDVFLNEKNCTYQVFIQTGEDKIADSNGDDLLPGFYEEYADQAVEALLTAFDKDTGAAAQRTVKEVL